MGETRLFAGGVLAVLLLTPGAPADVWYVDAGMAVSGDGQSWDQAFRHLRDALEHDDFAAGDEVWVAAGCYVTDLQTNNAEGSNDPNFSFELRSGRAVYGGFPPGGGDGTFAARDPSEHVTILTGFIADLDDDNPSTICFPPDPAAGDCLTQTPGVSGCIDPMCCTLVCDVTPFCCFTGWDDQCVVVAADICGTANARHVISATGGRLDGFTITGGNADGELDYWGAPLDTVGGAIEINGNPVVTNCIFVGNDGDIGGAVGVNGGAPTFVNCVFRSNHAGNGGAVYARSGCAPLFVNCLFESNVASAGNGVYAGIGGAVYALPGNTTTLVNCTLIDNLALQDGGAMYGAYQAVNTIFWGNGTAPIIDADSVTYSCIETGYPGPGNVSAFPGFVSALNDDYRLASGSVCIDAGDAFALPADVTDLDDDGDHDEPVPLDALGIARITGETVDLGAWEACPYDLDASGDVGTSDFMAIIGTWGSGGTGDFNGNGEVDTIDLLDLLGHWGDCRGF